MSSRNNNFSNRAQKAKISILQASEAIAKPPTHVQAQSLESSNKDTASVLVTWRPPGEDAAYIGTDGKEYSGKSQDAQAVVSYTVQSSCDGGQTWKDNNCGTSDTECRVDGLPGDKACAFRVRSGSVGGWGAPSEVGIALTTKTSSPPPAAVIVVIVIAVLLLVACGVWYFMCGGKGGGGKKPPPPPPGGGAGFNNIPAPGGYGQGY